MPHFFIFYFLFFVWVTFALGEANQSLLFVLQTAPRSVWTKLFGNKVCPAPSEPEVSIPPDPQRGFWDHCWGRLVDCGGMYTCQKAVLLFCVVPVICIFISVFLCCKVLSPRVLDLVWSVFIRLFEVSEEGMAFGASSSVFYCCSGNGLSFEYVGLRDCGGLCVFSNSTFIYYFLWEETRGLGKGWGKKEFKLVCESTRDSTIESTTEVKG